ncbi:FHA domain-containing protein [Mycolicibacterium boenickei]
MGATDLVVSINGQRLLLRATDGDVIVGREAPRSGIRLTHPAISRLHARLEPGPQWKILDYDSRNGLYLDGQRVFEAVLTEGMAIRLGAPDGLTVVFGYAASEDETDVITPAIRQGLPLDSAALTLDAIAASLIEMPVATDPDYPVRAANLRRRIGELTRILASHPDGARSEGVQALLRIALIYARRLPGDDSEGQGSVRAKTAHTAIGATLRSQGLEP